MSAKQNTSVVYAVQGEKNARKIRFDLFNNGAKLVIDRTASVLISYKKPDGNGGMYDVLENGESAFEFSTDSTNSVIITLAEQVLTTVGSVPLLVSFVVGDEILSTFRIIVDVSENPGIDVAESVDYFSLSVAIDAAKKAAEEIIKGEASSNAVLYIPQELTDEQKQQARKNIGIENGSGLLTDAVLYTPQELTDEQKAQARENIGVSDEENVNKPGIWHGKKFAAFGTSITWACKNYSGGYLEVIKNRCEFASYLNAGVSGAAMANNTANGNGINHKIRNTDISGYDLVLIECTTNDFKLNVPLGTVGIMGDTDFATNIFCGALRDSIEYILKADPKKHILLISDTQRDNAGYDVNYTNTAGHKLIDYVQALREIAELYGLPVCDWYSNSGFNALTLGTYTIDGLHPNGTGYTVLGNLTASEIEKMYCSFIATGDTGGDSGGGDDEGGDDGGDVNPNIITINGVEYDASVADGFDYRMVLDVGGTKYLYYSTQPFKVYEPKYSECYFNPSYRATASGKTFGNGTAITVAGNHVNCGDGYYALANTRTLDQYVWTNHDLYYSDSDRIAVAKS